MKNKKNKKGFGLVTSVMIILVLLIMAAGFFQLTDYSTKSVSSDIEKLRLYWAVESASNYNVNWWVNQTDDIRINWPDTYTDPVENVEYPDTCGTTIHEDKFAYATGTTNDGLLYLHASSFCEGNTTTVNPELENFEGKKLITARYKGERKNKPGQAVWVLDSYAWDPQTGEIANIVISNVYNTKIIGGVPLLVNSEAIISSLAGTGFNGSKGAFHEKDVRYGPCYFADLIRIDRQTGSPYGPRFYVGPVTSSAVNAGSPVAQSRWGNPVDTSTNLINVYDVFGYGIALRCNSKTEAEAIALIQESFPACTYIKDAPALSTAGTVWSWNDIVNDGRSKGVYFLEDGGFPTGNSVSVELMYDALNKATTAKIIAGGVTKTIPICKGAGNFNSIAVTKNYGTVSIKGVSNQNFTLVTENNTVNITDNFYLAEMAPTLIYLNSQYPSDIEQYNTKKSILEKMWNDMAIYDPQGHLSVISCLNNDIAMQDSISYSVEPSSAKTIFSTAAYLTWDGFMNTSMRTNPDLKFFNIGSIITLDLQSAEGGDASGRWTKALLQDQRYLDPDRPIPPLWGPGPSDLEDILSLSGLNRDHRWSNQSITKTDDWSTVVWRNGAP
ncbi:MAG: hypothetical protein L6407_10105 [Candidatus Delongbacteria bacterium]|nr:hypothetical protein [Candidatus Delongbacteria bacterium]